MKKSFLLIALIVPVFSVLSQDFSNLWTGHFSYFNITDVVTGNGRVFAASENAVFSFDLSNNELQTFTTIEGLSGEVISTIHVSDAFNLLIIGYQNGLMDIYDIGTDQVTTVVDILDKPTIPPDLKRINHFHEYSDFIYISTDFGISVYDMGRLEFGDTYFIGNGGVQSAVLQTSVFGDYIYAAMGPNGMKRALVASDDLINFEEWSQLFGGNLITVESLEDRLYATGANRTIFDITTGSAVLLASYNGDVIDHKSADGNMVVVLDDEVFVYDADFNQVSVHQPSAEYDFEFTSATTFLDEVFIGTEGSGLLNAPFASPSEYVDIFPDGPLRNEAFKIQASTGILWVAYGDYSTSYNPSPIRAYGLSQYQNEEWNNIPWDSLFTARNLNYITFNPSNPNQVYVSSFLNGIVELNNGSPTVLYDNNNSGLESLVLPNNPNFVQIRVSGTTFDNQGILWSMTSKVDRPLKSYNPETGQWQGFDFTEIIPNGLTGESGFSDIVIGANGTKWIGSRRSGLIGYRESGLEGGERIKNINDEDLNNLPDRTIQALAIDNRNQLWIGTIKGLRVLFNTSNFFDEEIVTVQPIIILEDGIPKELLQFQFITDIKVDGGNNKWIGTVGSGVFYFTSDGQETIYHFTTDNSPLPSNNVNDITIDSSTGIVYFATDRGLVSFRSGSSKPQDDLADAFVYPNPVRPGFSMFDKKIKIQNLSENVNVKITDIEGNLVAEAQSNRNLRFRGYNLEIDGGTAYWNGRNLANNAVASGVYLVMLNDLDSFETRVLKLMVVR